MYTVAVEHFVQAGVRIKRGAKHADETLTHIRGVLQCQMCEEYAILPGTQVPTGEVDPTVTESRGGYMISERGGSGLLLTTETRCIRAHARNVFSLFMEFGVPQKGGGRGS